MHGSQIDAGHLGFSRVETRGDFDAMREAVLDLRRRERYRRRACSRQKRALRAFISIRAEKVRSDQDAR
jgi:hypothetical protein